MNIFEHIRHKRILLLIYSVSEVHKSGSVGCGLNCVKQ